MTVREIAAGRPGAFSVAFAHGLEDSWESWLPMAARLSPDWRTVALDLPWRPGNDYRWRRRPSASWLGAELDRLDRRPDLLVAHSYGANALLELLCAGDPRVPEQVVLICPLYKPPDVTVTWSLFDRARRAFERHIHDSLRSRLGARLSTLDPEVVDLMIAKATDRIGPAGFLAVFEQFSSSASWDLSRIRARVLVLAGGSDPTLSPAAARTLTGGIAGARLSIDADHDHFCYVRRPDEIAATVRAFTLTPDAEGAAP